MDDTFVEDAASLEDAAPPDEEADEEISPSEEVVGEVPPPHQEEIVSVPPVLPVADAPPHEDSSGNGILDSFLAGVLAGVSAGSEDEDDSLESSPEPIEVPDAPLECVGIESYALSPIVSSSGLKGILLEVLGPYDNVVTQFKYQQANNSYYTYVNEVTPDYPWIASAVLFIALVVSLFSLLKRSFSSWLK